MAMIENLRFYPNKITNDKKIKVFSHLKINYGIFNKHYRHSFKCRQTPE